MASFDLGLQLFKQLILDFEHGTTPLTGEVHVVLVGAGLVVMPVPVHMHQVKLINDAEFLERFQGAIDGGQVQAGHLLLGPAQDFRRVEVLASLLKYVRDHAALAGQTETMLAELGGDGAALLEVLSKDHIQLRRDRNRDYPKIYTFMSRIISQELAQWSAQSSLTLNHPASKDLCCGLLFIGGRVDGGGEFHKICRVKRLLNGLPAPENSSGVTQQLDL